MPRQSEADRAIRPSYTHAGVLLGACVVAIGNVLFGLGLFLAIIGLWSVLRPIRRLRIKSRGAAAVVLCASLASCIVGVQLAPPPSASEAKKPAKVATTPAPGPPSIDGVIVEGGADQVKASGLRLCDGDYYGFTCTKAEKVTFLGVPALRASAHLAYPDTLKLPVEKRTPADLRYEEVVFEFEPVEIAYPCDKNDPADPNACAKRPDAALAILERKLLAGGWRYWSYRWGREYVKADAPVKITIGTNHLYDGQVSLRRADPEEVREQLQRIATEAAGKAKLAADKQAFINGMAK